MRYQGRRSRRVLRRFLRLAAVAFALGGEIASASAGDGDVPMRIADRREEGLRSEEVGDDPPGSAYRHVFALRSLELRAPTGGPRAQLRVLDARGRYVAQLALHGPAMVGPFGDGAYTVLIVSEGVTEVHRVRVGSDTLPYLQFTEVA